MVALDINDVADSKWEEHWLVENGVNDSDVFVEGLTFVYKLFGFTIG